MILCTYTNIRHMFTGIVNDCIDDHMFDKSDVNNNQETDTSDQICDHTLKNNKHNNDSHNNYQHNDEDSYENDGGT